MIAVLVIGLAAGSLGALLSESTDPPRPFAPRADALGPCGDCDDQLLDSALLPAPQSVTDSVDRGPWSICPAGYRGAGRLGEEGRCLSDTTFRVWSETIAGLYRTPGLAPIAFCEVGEEKDFTVAVERTRHRGPTGPDNPAIQRSTAKGSCAGIRRTQPELAQQRFEVHRLSRVSRVLAEPRDTASRRVVGPARDIGQIRFPLAFAIGVEAALTR
ncbi:hypothetical protein [Tsukamurella pulmonis]|uniref:hypothetical protein n=1 Tax=Tsukamurella pulmonis TaxID=47312 RepID=UPI0011133C08|nr:hypothetical protein [Tsukamurella pulmonis]